MVGNVLETFNNQVQNVKSFLDDHNVKEIVAKVGNVAKNILFYAGATLLCTYYSGATTVGLTLGFMFPKEVSKITTDLLNRANKIPLLLAAVVIAQLVLIYFLGSPMALPIFAGLTALHLGSKLGLMAESKMAEQAQDDWLKS